MPLSITKAQASALAENFLDSIGTPGGSDYDDRFLPKKAITEFLVIAGELIEDANKNLIRSKAISTGKLAESITAEEPIEYGTTLQIDISMNFYGKFINDGVNGTRRNLGSPYSFRNEYPSKNMVEAFQEWIKRAGIKVRTVKHLRNYGRSEQRNRDVSEISSAYAMAKSIKMLGIKPRGFMTDAIVSADKKISDRLGLALRVDLLDFTDNIKFD